MLLDAIRNIFLSTSEEKMVTTQK